MPTTSGDQTTLPLRLSRTFPVPPERVFQAWTDPAILTEWWWPTSWATEIGADLRPGGRFRFATTGRPAGQNFAVSGTFIEVSPPQRLVYTWSWDGEDSQTLVTVELREHRVGAELVLVHEHSLIRPTETTTAKAGPTAWTGSLRCSRADRSTRLVGPLPRRWRLGQAR